MSTGSHLQLERSEENSASARLQLSQMQKEAVPLFFLSPLAANLTRAVPNVPFSCCTPSGQRREGATGGDVRREDQ